MPMTGTISRIARLFFVALFATLLAGGCMTTRDYYDDEYDSELEHEVDYRPAVRR
jgi:hypothetical protein